MCIPTTKANSNLFFCRRVVKLGQLLTRAKFSSFNFKIKPAVDSRYSWAVCVSSFILQFFVFGLNNSFGTLFLELLKDFKRSESATGKCFLSFCFQKCFVDKFHNMCLKYCFSFAGMKQMYQIKSCVK